MSWWKVILFAFATGIYTGFIMIIPALKDTSFQDIGFTYEWWVIFAVILVANCRKNWDAMLKCFVFFLISQPVIYAIEIIFGSLKPELAFLYYKSTWLPMTFLTLPGGFIAWYCKKQNLLGSIVLGLGNTIQFVMGTSYAIKTFADFPHHLLTVIVCFVSAFLMSFTLQKKHIYRAVSLIVPTVLVICIIIFAYTTGRFL